MIQSVVRNPRRVEEWRINNSPTGRRYHGVSPEQKSEMPPATRVGDMHVCPMVTGVVPHVGGPILPPGCPTVLIGNMPAARVGDQVTCVGPPDVIALGSTTVLIGNMMAARAGDMTAHGGSLVLGSPTVIIGG
jgi:uncharacterized Zn-binding protein involved in type VI secretion